MSDQNLSYFSLSGKKKKRKKKTQQNKTVSFEGEKR